MAWVIVVLWVVWVISLPGFIVNGPNQARVVQLFGKYVGTVKETGFFYGNPFYWRTRVSLRVRTFETGWSLSTAQTACRTAPAIEAALPLVRTTRSRGASHERRSCAYGTYNSNCCSP